MACACNTCSEMLIASAVLAMGMGKFRCRRRLRRQGQYFEPLRRYQHRVLPLGGQTVIFGHYRPAVGELANRRGAGVDHRFHRERHARFHDEPGAGLSVVQYLWLFVKSAADAMTAEFPHYAESMLLGAALYRMSNIAKSGAGTHLADAVPHAVIGDFTQTLCLHRRRPDVEHAAGVAVPTIFDDRDINIDDVAGFQFFLSGHTVTDHMINRGAD